MKLSRFLWQHNWDSRHKQHCWGFRWRKVIVILFDKLQLEARHQAIESRIRKQIDRTFRWNQKSKNGKKTNTLTKERKLKTNHQNFVEKSPTNWCSSFSHVGSFRDTRLRSMLSFFQTLENDVGKLVGMKNNFQKFAYFYSSLRKSICFERVWVGNLLVKIGSVVPRLTTRPEILSGRDGTWRSSRGIGWDFDKYLVPLNLVSLKLQFFPQISYFKPKFIRITEK